MKKFIKEYTVELIAGVVILFGIFLMAEGIPIRDTIVIALTQVLEAILFVLKQLFSGLGTWFVGLTGSDAMGILIVLGAIAFIVWRIRYRFLNDKRWEIDFCPKCHGPVMRVHRSVWDRVLGFTFLPEARRYRCMDANCGWNGLLRRHILHHRRRHERVSGVSDQENP